MFSFARARRISISKCRFSFRRGINRWKRKRKNYTSQIFFNAKKKERERISSSAEDPINNDFVERTTGAHRFPSELNNHCCESTDVSRPEPSFSLYRELTIFSCWFATLSSNVRMSTICLRNVSRHERILPLPFSSVSSAHFVKTRLVTCVARCPSFFGKPCQRHSSPHSAAMARANDRQRRANYERVRRSRRRGACLISFLICSSLSLMCVCASSRVTRNRLIHEE